MWMTAGLASRNETSTIFHPPHWGGFYSGMPGIMATVAQW